MMPTENKNLGSFLMKLSEDPTTLKAFEEDPHKEMKSANLSAQEIQIVLTKDSRSMSAALKHHVEESLVSERSNLGTHFPVVTMVVVVVMPHIQTGIKDLNK